MIKAFSIVSTLLVISACGFKEEKEQIQFEFTTDTSYFLGKWYDPESGALLQAQEFYNKVPNGFQIIYHDNGEVRDSGNFRHGLAHGERYIYNNNGEVLEKYRYQNDSLKELITFDDHENISTYEFFNHGAKRVGMIKLDPKGKIVDHFGKFASITDIKLIGKVAKIKAEIACPMGFERSLSLHTIPSWESVPFDLNIIDRYGCSSSLIIIPNCNQKIRYGLIIELVKEGQGSTDTLIFFGK